MYVGVGGGTVYARFRESLAVRNAPAATVAASWIDKSSATPTNPTSGTSSGYCDTQCSYDNYVYIPAAHFPQSGASIDTVYLSGSNRYAENNWGPLSVHCCPDNPATGRSDGRAVIVSTDAGTSFTDMTADHTSDRIYPSELSSGPARARRQPDELEAVLRGRRRRHHSLERQLRERARPTAPTRT